MDKSVRYYLRKHLIRHHTLLVIIATVAETAITINNDAGFDSIAELLLNVHCADWPQAV